MNPFPQPSLPKNARIAVLISGRGSNLRALLDAFPPHSAAASQPQIALVIANHPDAAGLIYARDAKVASRVISHQNYPNRSEFEAELDRALRDAQIDLVCLAGFMRLLSAEFVDAWWDRVINIHPSLLPKYKGLDTHKRVLAAGETETGCSVHFVRAAIDEGPLIAQKTVPILPDDDEASLAARVLAAEHGLYKEAINRLLGLPA